MGRRPNPLILRYFQRGPKLEDNSNRYPHTCKLCGENFPKGRIDSLTNHITKSGKCPAISEPDRINACLTLHGIPNSPASGSSSAMRNGPNNARFRSHAMQARVAAVAAAFAQGSSHLNLDEPLSTFTHHGITDEMVLDQVNQQYVNHHQSPESVPQDQVPSTEGGHAQGSGPMSDPILAQQWSALEALAEASRQVDLNEKQDASPMNANANSQNTADLSRQNETHHNTVEVTVSNTDSSVANPAMTIPHELVHLQSALLDPQLSTDTQENPNHSMEGQQSNTSPGEPHISHRSPTNVSLENSRPMDDSARENTPLPWGSMSYVDVNSETRPPQASAPIIHVPANIPTLPLPPFPRPTEQPLNTSEAGTNLPPLNIIPAGKPKSRHTRARFSVTRRREVQEMRQLGACIRCRILRKTCGKGDPCETCCKVLSPRVWRTGCVRTRLHEQLELYSAGVQVVLAQNRYNMIKSTMHLSNSGAVIEASHFPEYGVKLVLPAYDVTTTTSCDASQDSLPETLNGYSSSAVATPPPTSPSFYEKEKANVAVLESGADVRSETKETTIEKSQDVYSEENYSRTQLPSPSRRQVPSQHSLQQPSPPPETKSRAVMIDFDSIDVPAKVEEYMQRVLPVLIDHEPSHFMRVALQTAQNHLQTTEDELLRHAVELWGLVEMIDRERQWQIVEKRFSEGIDRWIRDPTEQTGLDIYTIMLIQLNAATERKANATSKALLSKMQRYLQDSKVKVGFRMFLTALIFLNCVEKSTWAFKAWEQDNLRDGWPLERQPGTFTSQGQNIASLLKTLLHCRKVLPQVERDVHTGKIGVLDQDQDFVTFFRDMDLSYDVVLQRQERSDFDPADSRSLELTSCSYLLLGS